MKQPALGIVATALVIACSVGFIALWDFGAFNGWVSFFALSFIPFEVMAGVLWNGSPPLLARLRQPAKGAALIAITLAAGVLVSQVVYRTLGASQGEPGPMLAFFSICVIVTTFFWTIAFGGWPFTALTANPVVSGLLTLAGCYALGTAIYWTFSNFEYLQGAPVYVASADPHGLFTAWNVVVCYMSALTMLFSWLCFDLWPLTARPRLMTQPLLGVVVTGTSLVLGYAIFAIAVDVLGVQNVEFLLRVPIAVIFGTILVLNMCQNTVAAAAQPAKGAVNLAVAAVVGSVLLAAYQGIEPFVSGAIPAGPEALQRELFQVWTANALLAVTFPLLVFHAAFLDFWPLARRGGEQQSALRETGHRGTETQSSGITGSDRGQTT